MSYKFGGMNTYAIHSFDSFEKMLLSVSGFRYRYADASFGIGRHFNALKWLSQRADFKH